MKKRLLAIVAAAVLALGMATAPASAESQHGTRGCLANYNVSAYTSLSALGGGSGTNATHLYVSSGTTVTRTVSGWNLRRSQSGLRSATWTVSSLRAFISYGADCAQNPV